ncbi:MAG: phosphatidylserine decarboxylase family protein [Deltaproteobacteria bacterium]|nr:phosphatidylserine decarboxylase family protein [Deltaproteobacteria bacterium]
MSRRSIIVREGLPFILLFGAATLVAAFFHAFWITGVLLILTLFTVSFFRNPDRKIPDGSKLVLSPADGRVLKVEEGISSELAEGSFKKISIFMNIFNVHVNRLPCSGSVRAVRYHEGKFLSANLDKASACNERNTVVVRTDDGRDIVTIQIAGLIARRIVCWLKEGMSVKKGDRFGLICFGSRLEVLLPEDATPAVKPGDKVRAGETTIGVLK